MNIENLGLTEMSKNEMKATKGGDLLYWWYLITGSQYAYSSGKKVVTKRANQLNNAKQILKDEGLW